MCGHIRVRFVIFMRLIILLYFIKEKSYCISILISLKLMRKILKHHFWVGISLEFNYPRNLYYSSGGGQNKIEWSRSG